MHKSQKEKLASLNTKFITISMIIVWIYIITQIAGMDKPFIAQAPYCILSTMVIFGILSLIQKAIKWWADR